MKKAKKNILTGCLIGVMAISVFISFGTSAQADRYEEWFRTWNQNIYTGATSNYKYWKEWYPNHYRITYYSTGWSSGAWNYRVQELYTNWAGK